MRPLALTLKIVAIAFWLGTAWMFLPKQIADLRATGQPAHRDSPPERVAPSYRGRTFVSIGETILLLGLSIVPNRFLVTSRWSFLMAFAIAYFPAAFLIFNSWGHGGLMSAVGVSLLLFSPLPFSFALSYWSSRHGERVGYA